MLSVLQYDYPQIPLIHIVHEDDLVLLDAPDAAWFEVLYNFPWKDYQIYAAQYYDALYEFNIREAKKRQERIGEQGDQIGETKEEAKERLLFDRVTMQKYQGGNPSIIYEGEVPESELPKIEPESVSPGVVPKRLGGKKPKCFFALLKSFLGATLMGFAPDLKMFIYYFIATPALYVFVGLPLRMRKMSIASSMFQVFENWSNLTRS